MVSTPALVVKPDAAAGATATHAAALRLRRLLGPDRADRLFDVEGEQLFATALGGNTPTYEDFLADREALRKRLAATGAGAFQRRVRRLVMIITLLLSLLILVTGILLRELGDESGTRAFLGFSEPALVLMLVFTAWLINGVLQRFEIVAEARAAVDFAVDRPGQVRRGIPLREPVRARWIVCRRAAGWMLAVGLIGFWSAAFQSVIMIGGVNFFVPIGVASLVIGLGSFVPVLIGASVTTGSRVAFAHLFTADSMITPTEATLRALAEPADRHALLDFGSAGRHPRVVGYLRRALGSRAVDSLFGVQGSAAFVAAFSRHRPTRELTVKDVQRIDEASTTKLSPAGRVARSGLAVLTLVCAVAIVLGIAGLAWTRDDPNTIRDETRYTFYFGLDPEMISNVAGSILLLAIAVMALAVLALGGYMARSKVRAMVAAAVDNPEYLERGIPVDAPFSKVARSWKLPRAVGAIVGFIGLGLYFFPISVALPAVVIWLVIGILLWAVASYRRARALTAQTIATTHLLTGRIEPVEVR